MSMALLHGSVIHQVFFGTNQSEPAAVSQAVTQRKACYGRDEYKTSQIPSEQATQGQRNKCHQQEVGDPVEVEWTEGHHGDGQGQGEAGSQRQEFAERIQAKLILSGY